MRSLYCLVAIAALPSAAMAQEDRTPREKKPVRQQVNLRVDEWFDKERSDGVTEAKHPYTLVAPNFSYDGACHWRRRDRNQTTPFPDPPQDEDEDKPIPELTPVPTSSGLFRDGGGGVKFQIPTRFDVPAFDAISPSDGFAVEFDDVEAEGSPGLFVSTTLGFGDIFGLKDVEVVVFVDYVAGRFTGDEDTEERLVPDGRGGFELRADTYNLDGDFWIAEIGVAPILKTFATDDGSFRLDLMLAAGFYFGRLENMKIDRSGATTESFDLSDESVSGFFAGPTAHGFYRISESFRIGAFAEFWRLVGDLDGWTALVGVEARFDF